MSRNTNKNATATTETTALVPTVQIVEKIEKTVHTATAFTKYHEIYDDLCKCTTKKQLVDTMNKYGLRTTTKPTTTPNTNDLYIQFIDKSRLLITKKSLKLYTNNCCLFSFSDIETFDIVNDGSYRNRRATVKNTFDTFKYIFSVFMNNGDNYLPTYNV